MPSPSSLQWLSLIATIWLQTINGANTDFPVYSSQLKQLLSISEVQLNDLAFASDAGKLFSWLAGFAATYLPLTLILFIGAAFSLIGYGLQFLFLTQKITHLSYWQVFLLTALSGNGICWINTVCYLICIRNFSSYSRIAVGISTSYVGLSAKVYSAIADAIFHPREDKKANTFLLLNAICPLFVSVVASPAVREYLNSEGEEGKDGAFLVMFVITIATGVCSVLSSINGPVSSWFGPREKLISLALLLVSPLLIMPVYVKVKEKSWDKLRTVYEISVEEGGGRKEEKVVGLKGELREGVGFKVMVRKMEFWLYYFSYMFGATIGMVFLNNLGQIAESRGVSDVNSIVSLASSFGYFGRLMPSLMDYCFSRKGYMDSSPRIMATMMVPLAAAFFLLLSTSNLILYTCTALIGACSGSITAIAVSATAELFGTKNFAINHNIIVTNIPIASFLFGYLAGLLYQRQGGRNSCMGTDCYNKTFFIWGCVSSVGTLLCTVLYVKTRRVSNKYQQ
ncbi:protein NUCLEAR FUSION DEFECTIVE 4-like [Phalaenopsis equestris]|uniref:protein NUCLEAR FUSION DEFECTIVE 4-like n=1 Tax=Phalaenopsis equestris TaxID=78828 RepID=UPI0009E43516|nr:protein NUCLEAR FUSION DEFECTIVE 4-like [Phalaenopsis equestris]